MWYPLQEVCLVWILEEQRENGYLPTYLPSLGRVVEEKVE